MNQRPRSVQLFCTCLVNEVYPRVGFAVAEVLERAGVTVEVDAEQTCCGQPAYNSGFWDEARAVAARTVRRLAQTDGPIVVPSGSCADMLVHQLEELFREDPPMLQLARDVAGRTYEFTQFVDEVLGGLPGELRAESAGSRVAYHGSCHLRRGLGVDAAPRRLLESAGVESVALEREEECCGFGGMFAAKQPEISGAMMRQKLDAVRASGAGTLTSCDMGCLLHLEGGLHRSGDDIEVRHVAELMVRDSKPNEPS